MTGIKIDVATKARPPSTMKETVSNHIKKIYKLIMELKSGTRYAIKLKQPICAKRMSNRCLSFTKKLGVVWGPKGDSQSIFDTVLFKEFRG